MSAAGELRHAATVLLLRDAGPGVEVFMERRHIRSDFVGGAWVFPGGAVDPEDHFDESLCVGLDDATASRRLGIDHGGLSYWVAAIRECFEEAGVLLAYDADGALLDYERPEVERHFRALRDRLNAGELGLEQLVREEGLRLATDRVVYWSHWVTPAGQPRRYDTRFFAARVPRGQTAEHDAHELVHSAWVTPENALDRGAALEWMIIFPTVKTLMRLGEFESAQAALEWAEHQRQVPRNQPKVFVDGEAVRVVLPEDEGYERAREDASAVDQKVWFAWADEYRALKERGWGPGRRR